MDNLERQLEEPVDADALEILRLAGVIRMVCEHGFDIDLCLYSPHEQ